MKKYGKHTLLGWSWRILLLVVLTPILLFAFLAILIYIPPVQKWAVDEATDWLSEEMQMVVSINKVRLKFPLNLSLGGMLAIQEGDTVLNADELQLSVQVRPLFDKQINVDDIKLINAVVNTRGLIKDVLIKGNIGRLEAYTHGVNLTEELVNVNYLELKDANILLAIPDTVAPDTAKSEPSKLKLDFQDIRLQKVKFQLSLPQEKGYDIKDLIAQEARTVDLDSYFYKATLHALVDIGNGVYTVGGLEVENSKVRYQDAVDAINMNLKSDSVRFALPMDLYVDIVSLSGEEKSGLCFKDINGKVLMDSLTLTIPAMTIHTDDSDIDIDMKMDLNTWEDIAPGNMQLAFRSVMGKSDVLKITRYVDRYLPKDGKLGVVRELANEYLPTKPITLNMTVDGNLQDLYFNEICTNIDGIGKIEGSARLINTSVVTTDIRGLLAGGESKVRGGYNIDTETYELTADLTDFDVNKYADLPEQTRLTGVVIARGKGFDIYSPSTHIDATAKISKGHYGKIDLSTIDAKLALKDLYVDIDLSCNNEQIVTDFILDTKLGRNSAEGVLDIDLPYINLQSMGFTENKFVLKTDGKVNFQTNMKDQFHIDSYVNGLDMELADRKVYTEDFKLLAESTHDSTIAKFKTGDLSLDFNSPENIMKLIAKGDKFMETLTKQANARLVEFDVLRSLMPTACLRADIGDENPFSTFLEAKGFKFNNLSIDVDASPELGIVGNGHIDHLKKDSMNIDKVFFDIRQDSEYLRFNSGIVCKEQPSLPAFNASVEGYLGSRVADAHLMYYDKDGKKGIDLGTHVVGLDSVWHLTMYPDKPIIAYQQYELADTSYLDFYREGCHPIIGDVSLTSVTDDCEIFITGLDNEGQQRAHLEVDNFNLNELSKVLPLFPNMEGNFNIDAVYQEQDGRFRADGILDIEGFVYEDMKVGDIGSMFTYEPEGTSVHKVEGDISYYGTDVITLNGSYDVSGNGRLDANIELLDIPMTMLSPFVPDQLAKFDGTLAGKVKVEGPTDRLNYNGFVVPNDVHAFSPYYSVNLSLSNDTLKVDNSKIGFDKYAIYGAGVNPMLLTGSVDFSNLDEIPLSLTLTGKNVQLIKSNRTSKSVLYGNAFGDMSVRITGTSNDVVMRGVVNVLNTTNITYLMTETALSQGDRLDDIVTFVDFSLPPDTLQVVKPDAIMGIDMNLRVNVEDGTKVRCELSADRQSYVNVNGGGSLNIRYTPEGVMNVQGRLTVNEGDMKYTLPVIPLKNFTLQKGSSVDFYGDLFNPTLNIMAKSRTKATVGIESSSTRSVVFDVGLKVTETLNNMGLAFTLEAPEDANMQNELENYSDEERGKLAVALLATGMYVADNNASALNANTALSTFLQSELNQITGRALSSFVDVSLGVDQTSYADGSIGTDYSFKFSKRFFSDRLSVVIGGRVSDNKMVNQSTDIGSFIDDVSLEWRIDPAATRSVRLFHKKDYSNVFEGMLEKNGAGVVLRKRIDSLSELIFWKKKEEDNGTNPPILREGQKTVSRQ